MSSDRAGVEGLGTGISRRAFLGAAGVGLVTAGLTLAFPDFLRRSALAAAEKVDFRVTEFIHYTEDDGPGNNGIRSYAVKWDDGTVVEVAHCLQTGIMSYTSHSWLECTVIPIEQYMSSTFSVDDIRAALWFSYGAPGYERSLFPAKFDDKTMDEGRLRLASHYIMAYVVNGDDDNHTVKSKTSYWIDPYDGPYGSSTGSYKPWVKSALTEGSSSTLAKMRARASEVPAGFKVYAVITPVTGGEARQNHITYRYAKSGSLRLHKRLSY